MPILIAVAAGVLAVRRFVVSLELSPEPPHAEAEQGAP